MPICKINLSVSAPAVKNKDAAVGEESSGAGGTDHVGGDDDKLRLPLHFHLTVIIIIIGGGQELGPGLTPSLLTDKSRVLIREGG